MNWTQGSSLEAEPIGSGACRSWTVLGRAWRTLRLDEVTPDACKEWASRLAGTISSHYFNNTIGTLKQVLAVGIRELQKRTGRGIENPASSLDRVSVRQKQLRLPEAPQFKALVGNLRQKSGRWGHDIGDLVEFLAYSGLRVQSEAAFVNWEDVDWERREIVVRGHPETATKNGEVRRIPILPDMEGLLKRLLGTIRPVPSGPILKVHECGKALTRACQALGLSKLTHHDFRHLFATRCIESGVDVPTVSRWLGHKDGGALAMKTYGHLRNEHSQQMAAKVKF